VTRGVTPYQGFKFSERAYAFKALGREKVSFSMRPHVKVVNPVFRVDDWKSDSVEVRLDNDLLGARYYRWQLTRGDLILWLDKEIEKETEVEISP